MSNTCIIAVQQLNCHVNATTRVHPLYGFAPDQLIRVIVPLFRKMATPFSFSSSVIVYRAIF